MRRVYQKVLQRFALSFTFPYVSNEVFVEYHAKASRKCFGYIGHSLIVDFGLIVPDEALARSVG